MHPDGSQRVKIGIRLASRPEDLGEWLADGAAFEAAGADALWIDLAEDLELDPLTLTAALAAVTFRSLLVSALPRSTGSATGVARTLATIGKLSRGRLRILAGPEAVDPGTTAVYAREDARHWLAVAAPDNRATWRATLLDATGAGFGGVHVAADPRLIDLLRNPDDPGERLDLHLAQG
jgi:hypothetical protein